MTKEEIIQAIGQLSDEDRGGVLLETVKGMTVLGLSDFVKACEEAFGVSAAAPMAVATGPMPGVAAAEAEEEEEQTEFDVVLKEIGPKKIQVIKAVRTLRPDLGLKEAKELVDGTPTPIQEGISKEEAEAAKAKLEAEGAVIEVK